MQEGMAEKIVCHIQPALPFFPRGTQEPVKNDKVNYLFAFIFVNLLGGDGG